MGAVLLMTSLGLARRGRFFGAYCFLSLPQKLGETMLFYVNISQRLRAINLPLQPCPSCPRPIPPIVTTLPKSRTLSSWLSPRSSQSITSGSFRGIGWL